MAVLSAVGPVGLLTPVPGGAEWLVGLTQWHGRLLTVVDAGRLFGNAPSAGRWLLVLRGAPCETALAVDELLGPSAAADSTATPIDAATLARHPAFQPGAAGRPPQTES